MLSAPFCKRLQICVLFLAFPILLTLGSYEITCPENEKEAKNSNSEKYTPCTIILNRIQSANSEIGARSADKKQNNDAISGVFAFFFNLFWRSVNDAIAIITALLAVYTYLLWGSTAKIAGDTKESSERQLRAYISVIQADVLEQNEREPDNFEFRPKMVNDGQTPAHDVIYNAHVDLLPFPLPQNFTFPLPELGSPSVSMIGPRRENTMFIFSLRRFTIDELQEIFSFGNNRLYLYGTVIYRDVFNKLWHTNFCFSFVWGSKGISFHINNQYHNDAT